MRSFLLTLTTCLAISFVAGCGAPEEKKVTITPEQKAKNDQSHAAKAATVPGAGDAAKAK